MRTTTWGAMVWVMKAKRKVEKLGKNVVTSAIATSGGAHGRPSGLPSSASALREDSGGAGHGCQLRASLCQLRACVS
jgi:ribulose 1,5-bisphosphate carboxylase large subunit-like protein